MESVGEGCRHERMVIDPPNGTQWVTGRCKAGCGYERQYETAGPPMSNWHDVHDHVLRVRLGPKRTEEGEW